MYKVTLKCAGAWYYIPSQSQQNIDAFLISLGFVACTEISKVLYEHLRSESMFLTFCPNSNILLTATYSSQRDNLSSVHASFLAFYRYNKILETTYIEKRLIHSLGWFFLCSCFVDDVVVVFVSSLQCRSTTCSPLVGRGRGKR